MNAHRKIMSAIDGILTALVVILVLGSTLCFGGAIWWFHAVFAILAFLLSFAMLLRLLLERRLPLFKSPLTLLATLAIGLGILQLVPLPASIARRVSPTAHEIYSFGVIPELARADFPAVELGDPAPIRSPATLDRAATLRWLFGVLGCLGIFWTMSHFTDRLKRLYLVWGCVLAGFLINGALGLVQIMGGAEGLYGYIHAAGVPFWTPSANDLLDSPAATSLCCVSNSFANSGSITRQPAVMVPEEPVLMGTMMAGSGAFLALGSLALPLGLAVILHTLLPRGSRESLASRLSHKGQGSLVVLLAILLILSAFLVGMAAGPRFSVPFLIGLVTVGLPSSIFSRGWALGLLVILLSSIGLGGFIRHTLAGRCRRCFSTPAGLLGASPAALDRQPDHFSQFPDCGIRLWQFQFDSSLCEDS